MKTIAYAEYGGAYFETVGSGPGWNGLRENVCEVVDFGLLVLRAGERQRFATGGREYGMAVLAGTVDVVVEGERFAELGGRESIFTGGPSGVYAGCGSEVVVEARTDVEMGVGSAPSVTRIAPYAVRPEEARMGQWGEGNTMRHYRYLINGERPSERLWMAEVVVRDGRWATFPPHKHEEVPGEVFQEEMYYYRTWPEAGFGFCGEFDGKVGGDYAFVIRDRTIHKMPWGYHTVTAAPGCQVYYLAIYAGRDKRHRPAVHPEYAKFREFALPERFM